MFEKVRKKFIILAVLSVFIVLLLILGTVNIINYISVTKDSDNIISILKENNGEFGYGHGQEINSEIPFSIRYFTVTLTDTGEVIELNLNKIASVSYEEAVSYARELFAKNKTSGFYDNFRYGVLKMQSGDIMYIFVDCFVELKNFSDFLISSIIIGLAGTVIVFVLIFIFSGKIVRPIADSYRKQKQFITDAGHEIKTPLTIIGASTEVIEMQTGETEWTRSIKDQIFRLSSLTEKLIFLAKMEEQTDITMFEFSLSDVINECMQEFTAVAAAQNIEIKCNIQKSVLYTGNEEMIRRMITLLADNAIKYTDGKTVSVSLRTEGNKKIIAISNRASYIQDGDMSRLFERFVRGDASRNSGTGGHGIGLSVAQAITAAHNGKIKAECVKGTVIFTIIL